MEKSGRLMIEAVGLSKYYGDFAAIEDVSFQIREGEVVAFLGPNGAGKSTTMKLLTGYLAPSAGTARIAGYDVFTQRLEASRHLGYLPENGPLYADMTPIGLLLFFAEARGIPPSGGASESTSWWSCVPWRVSLANPSESSPEVIGSGWAWLRCCFTSPTS